MSIIQTKELTKDYAEVRAVDNLNLGVEKGEIFGLLGPNGAGKTTTLRLLSTVITPTGGTATVCGHDILSDPVEVRRRIGVVTCEVGLYDRFTARENVAYYGRLYGMSEQDIRFRTGEVFEMLDMASFADRRAGKFSTGMKQKVAIARAIIHDPDVLFLDEPTAGLDVLASQTVLNFIKDSRDSGKTIILSTHAMTTAQKMCGRVGIIHQGGLVALDTVDKVLSDTGSHDLEDAFMKLIRN